VWGTLSVLINNGSGDFVLSSSPSLGGTASCLATADLNGDGKPDIIASNPDNNTLSVLLNNGSGGFELSSSPSVGGQPLSVAAADVNGDGKVDLISVNRDDSTLSVLINNGSGIFELFSSPNVGYAPEGVAAADVNGDGKVDLISADSNDDTLSVLLNDGSGSFVLASAPHVGFYPLYVMAADLNGDGKADLVSANLDGTLSILTNNGRGGFVLTTSPVVALQYFAPYGVVAADVNGDGKPDLISANTDDTLAVLLNVPVFSGSFRGEFGGNGSKLTSLNAASLFGSVPSDSLTSIPAEKLTGLVPSDTLGNVPAEALFGTVSSRASIPAAILTGSVPTTLLTSVPAGNLTGSVPSASLTSVPASSLTGAIPDSSLSANVALRNANQTFSGNNTIGPFGNLSFGFQTRQMLNLYGTTYGIGVQASSLYFRCDNSASTDGFIWYKGGVHSDAYANAGGGGELMHLVDGGLYVHGTFNNTSDRNEKENFTAIEPRDVLEKVVAMPITRWNYKHDAATPHLGPVAQDFYAAFNIGPDDKHIATVDESGVALAAIQGLNQKLNEKDARIRELEQRMESWNS
jgi:hypothetical protein